MKKDVKIQLLDRCNLSSHERALRYMDFNEVWTEFNNVNSQPKSIYQGILEAVDAQVIRRALRTVLVILFFGVILINEEPKGLEDNALGINSPSATANHVSAPIETEQIPQFKNVVLDLHE